MAEHNDYGAEAIAGKVSFSESGTLKPGARNIITEGLPLHL